MENKTPPFEKKEELFFSKMMKKDLKSTSKWSTFISLSILILFGLISANFIVSIPRDFFMEFTDMPINVMFNLLFIASISILSVISGIVLFSFSTELKKALLQSHSHSLHHSFHLLSRFFLFSAMLLGITSLLIILVYFNVL